MKYIRRLVVVLLCGLLGAAVLSAPPASAAPPLTTPFISRVVATDTGTPVGDAAAITAYVGGVGEGLAGFQVQLLGGPSLADVVQTISIEVDLPVGGSRVVSFYGAKFGHTYDVRVRSIFVVNGVTQYSDYRYWSTSGYGDAGPVVPLLQVKPARDVAVTSPYTTGLRVTWKPPVADPTTEKVTGYSIVARSYVGDTDASFQINESSWACEVPCTSLDLQGLRNGVGYTVFVRSRTDHGFYPSYGPPLPPVSVIERWALPFAGGVPFAAPNRPSKLTATRSGSRARLMWAASSQAVNPVDSYKVYVNGKFRKTVKADRHVWTHVFMVTGIKKNKTYTFTVKAYNAHGYSSPLTIKKKWK